MLNFEVEWRQNLFLYQLYRIGLLALAGFGVWLIELFWPSFFNYPYFGLDHAINRQDILRFWPLFLYGLGVASLSAILNGVSRKEDEVFLWGLVTSTLAGIWEEVGYRAVFICYTMISLVFFNFVLGVGAWLGAVVVATILIGFALYLANEDRFVLGIIAGFAGLFIGWLGLFYGLGANPVYWFYETIIIPVINFVTFYQFNPVFYGSHDRLFIFGAILANSWFKDGHKYQGLLGVINSWVIGFVMLYATFTYGLVVAIILHAAYDIEIDVVRYVYSLARKN